MIRLDDETITKINSALFFSGKHSDRPERELRPWQYVQMEYERVGLVPPADMPEFRSVEDAEIWMCLDTRYNRRLREAV